MEAIMGKLCEGAGLGVDLSFLVIWGEHHWMINNLKMADVVIIWHLAVSVLHY